MVENYAQHKKRDKAALLALMQHLLSGYQGLSPAQLASVQPPQREPEHLVQLPTPVLARRQVRPRPPRPDPLELLSAVRAHLQQIRSY
jgi:hypothetical protein